MMDFADRTRDLANKIKARVAQVQTEEATKNALIMPFINDVLGYNVFDPAEVVPEFTADVGTKKGEKVDYAIIKDGKPIILFECKQTGSPLDIEQASQLFRYFSVTEAKFGVLTNGITYRFYSDLEKPNMMDSKPFFEFSILESEADQIEELKKFSKTSFNLEQIVATASELKYTKEIKRILGEQLTNPDENFVNLFTHQVYSGKATKTVMQQFGDITKSAFQQFISDKVRDRLKSALDQEQAPTVAVKPQGDIVQPERNEGDSGQIETTDEEIQAYYIVKAILGEAVDVKRIALRDQQTFCSVLLDDNNRKPICRFRFTPTRKRLGLISSNRTEELTDIDDLDGIYRYAEQLRHAITYYDDAAKQEQP